MERRRGFLLVLFLQMKKKYAARKFRFWLTFFQRQLTVRRANFLYLTGMNMFSTTVPNSRRYWAQDYEQNWFETMYENRENPIFKEFWYKEFRMKPETFEYVLGLVRVGMAKHDTVFRKAVTVEKRVAVALWRLSTGNSYRTVSKVFGLAKSTVVQLTLVFVRELTLISSRFIRFPETELETAVAIQKFKGFTNCKLPSILGAIDATHVEILSPDSESRVDYFSRKQKYTVVSQGIVGAKYIFHDFVTGYPGSLHDSRILRSCRIFQKLENRQVLNGPESLVDGMKIKPMLLGDGAYPASLWLLKPFPLQENITRERRNFNRALSSSRSRGENAFGILKCRWRILMKRLDNNLPNIPKTIMACAVLHNICQIRGDEFIDDQEVLNAVMNQEREARRVRQMDNDYCANADIFREHLTEYLQQE